MTRAIIRPANESERKMEIADYGYKARNERSGAGRAITKLQYFVQIIVSDKVLSPHSSATCVANKIPYFRRQVKGDVIACGLCFCVVKLV